MITHRTTVVLVLLLAALLQAAGCVSEHKTTAAPATVPAKETDTGDPLSPPFMTPVHEAMQKKSLQKIPEEKYVYIEHYIDTAGEIISGSCPSSAPFIDSPMDSFDEKSGIYSVPGPHRNYPVNDSLLFVYRYKESYNGIGPTVPGMNGWVKYGYSLPGSFSDAITVDSIAGNGEVTLHYHDEKITLNPNESRVNSKIMENRTGQCAAKITTTDRIFSSGFLDKSTIVLLS